jgi:trimethylamine:corrinoid methyltransferase-like protein
MNRYYGMPNYSYGGGDREEYTVWAEKGAKPLGEVLRQKVRGILENHHPEPLGDQVEEKIESISQRAANGTGKDSRPDSI